MGGSQLKQLKAALKSHGLTGQTNIKKKGKKAKAPFETRKDDQAKVLQNIRDQFNPFDVKVNKNKREDTGFVKGSVGKPGISKQIGETQRRAAYESKKKSHNKVGGVVDRRFGENDSSLTPEEKMLARFTKERQRQSKTNVFALNDESDDETLTHYGKSLSFKNDFGEDDSDLGEELLIKKRSIEGEDENEAPLRKKTKAEVMKEVIAKSKFYKHQRQLQKQQNETKVMDLDDEFGDIMQEFQNFQQPKKVIASKSEEDIKYDTAVKNLALDRRAVPADRTMTDEELAAVRTENQKKLEEARLRRMNNMSDDERAPEADDLDGFWEGDEDEDNLSHGDDAIEVADSSVEESTEKQVLGRTLLKVPTGNVKCPENHEEFIAATSNIEFEKLPKFIEDVIEHYDPKLAQGNKEKLGNFTKALLEHILYLTDSNIESNDLFVSVQETLIKKLKFMSDKYNEPLVEAFRIKIQEVQGRIIETQSNKANSYPLPSDMVFYSLIGMIFSTSDHYHLVVTPSVILMAESLEQTKVDSIKSIFSGCFIADMFLQYQRISRRFTPEVVSFLEKALLVLSPESSKIDISQLATTVNPSSTKLSLAPSDKIVLPGSNLSLRDLNSEVTVEMKSKLLLKVLSLVDKFVSIWKEKSAFIEISQSFIIILKHLIKYYAGLPLLSSLLAKLLNLKKILAPEHKPLKLQQHKAIAIATHAPKFEENFNPDKKSYDPNRDRQEIGKLKAQIKKERKFTMREIRKDTKFTAREQIKEKKVAYKEYHNKMANIVNTISTNEGAEKNSYEREKKQRKNNK